MAGKNRNSLIGYFQGLWHGISSTFLGMRLTLSYFFKPKVTMLYPEERPKIPDTHRGLHCYVEEDCTYCRACEQVCPVSCIDIKALGRGKDKLILKYDIDYSKCLFCNLCCEACLPKCLFMSQDYELVGFERSGSLMHFVTEKSPEEIEAHQKLLAQKQAEQKGKAQDQEDKD